MKIERIPREDVYQRLSKPFNPPRISSEEDETRFEEEWYSVSDGLKAELDRLGTWDAFASGDYYLDGNPGESRGIGFEITSQKMQRPELIDCVSRYLRSAPEIYEIHVTDPFGFDLFIGGDYALFCGTDLEAQRFGIG